MRKKRRLHSLARKVLMITAAAAALTLFSYAVNGLDSGQQQEYLSQLEDALRRSCVACYAVEGRYPPSVDYLESHYGLQINHEQYIIHYTIFAENLMPDITVLEK